MLHSVPQAARAGEDGAFRFGDRRTFLSASVSWEEGTRGIFLALSRGIAAESQHRRRKG